MPTTIAVVTTSRAEYGHLYWLLKTIQETADTDLDLVVGGAHHAQRFGLSESLIREDGFSDFTALAPLGAGDSRADLGVTTAQLTEQLIRHWERRRPDWVVVMADRLEMLAPAVAATSLAIPVAHVEGGDVSQGAVDDLVRNALSKLSHLHFATSAACVTRLVAMGEAPWRIEQVGALSLEHLQRSALPDRKTLQHHLGFVLPETFVLACAHPVTLASDPIADFSAMCEALCASDLPVVFCYPNADCGHLTIQNTIEQLCATQPRFQRVVNLPHRLYWRLLAEATVIVGNSSSGIMESASVGTACINIGDRQKGRETGDNTISVPGDAQAISEALDLAMTPEFQQQAARSANPYAPPKGQGIASERIVDRLLRQPVDWSLLRKEPAC
jgi:UDP-N-acetylglucosamine 2-epimerase (non-hydrolysing)/GDP/UDP-N,N'-diacetylbacillosamine 2-epimerase (hydrolysing)